MLAEQREDIQRHMAADIKEQLKAHAASGGGLVDVTA